MNILDLSTEPQHIPTLAAWHHQEWSHLNPDDSLEKRIPTWGLILLCQISGITLPKVVIPAWIAGIQAPWMVRSSPSMALDTRFPAGMTDVFLI